MDLVDSRLSVNQALPLAEFKREEFWDLLTILIKRGPHPHPQHFHCEFCCKGIFGNNPFCVN